MSKQETFWFVFFSPFILRLGICDVAMGMETYAIRDDDISASSFKEGSEPYHARVTGRKSWSPLDDDSSPYLEVKFESLKAITSILTQGGDNGEMVKKFTLQYLPEGEEHFKDVTMKIEVENSDGNTAVEEVVAQLPGNRDDHTIRENILETPLLTRVIRILSDSRARGPTTKSAH